MFCAFHHPELVNVPSYGPSEHTRHDSGQDKTKPSDNAQCNTGLHGRYRFGGGGSSSASVHRKRNFPPLGWMGFDSVLPKHNDNDHNISPLLNISISCGADCLRALYSNEIFFKIQQRRDNTTFSCGYSFVLAFYGNIFPSHVY